MFKTLLRITIIGFVALWVATAIAAMVAKRRLVPLDDPAADDVTLVAIFSPLQFRSQAGSFRGGRLEIWFGGGIIDLRAATLAPEGAELEVRVIFGGGQLVVPDAWRVTSHVTGPGGITDTRGVTEFAADAPELILDGLVLFGGFQITSAVSPEMERQFLSATGS